MATATKHVAAAKSPPARARPASKTASPAFRIYQDNAAGYHWEIVDRSGASLVQSRGFDSEDEAKQAARGMQQGARSAHFEPIVGGDTEPTP
ncbi:MAG TPA: hypothetical protein VNV44_15125 [Solirubrobacteraceae bacterium]|jgi:uncharacterized protein YegP (UPF0339 family)|nr:hypothetical protein [Solirubrobacteraceae bacterium]